MSLAGPFTYLDRDAAPTVTTDSEGREVVTYPPAAGVFYITDLDSFAASADLLTEWRVEPAELQFALAGTVTVTLCFPDAETAEPIVEAVNAKPPVPASPPPAPAKVEPRREIPKSRVQERVNAVGKLGDAFALLNDNPLLFGRWFAPDWPNVYADDEGLLLILGAIGCTPEQIAAITA